MTRAEDQAIASGREKAREHYKHPDDMTEDELARHIAKLRLLRRLLTDVPADSVRTGGEE